MLPPRQPARVGADPCLVLKLVPLPGWAVPVVGLGGVASLLGPIAIAHYESMRINAFVVESSQGGGYYAQSGHDGDDPQTASARRIKRARRGLAGCVRRLGSALPLCARPMRARVAPTTTPGPAHEPSPGPLDTVV